jgi:hypothetical protein
MLQPNLFSKIKWILFFQLLTLSVYAGGGPCLTISCPGDVTTDNDNGTCGAVVTFSTPTVSNTCLPPPPLAFGYTGSMQTFTVPAGVSSISISAYGASGGNETYGNTYTGGKGAYVSGTFSVTPGQVLNILVGGAGESQAVGGGGGGTFVALSNNTPLLVAGGGGGASTDANGVDASISQSGTNDSGGNATGGANGNGGGVCSVNFNDGGGGGGFYTDGSDATDGIGNGGFGGKSFVNGGAGGLDGKLDNACFADAKGGFGGGGGTTCYTVGGGGGGGYSGGAGGAHIDCSGVIRNGGGGGGSYNAGTNQTNTAGTNTGDGMVSLTFNYDLVVTQTTGLPSGSVFPLGTSLNTFTVAYGATTHTCSFTVTVNDTTPPVFTCQNDTTVSTDSGNCNAVVTYNNPLATELCPVISEQYFAYTGSLQGWKVPQGVTSITVYAAGAEGGGPNGLGGDGATLQGDFTVTPGDSILILVGEKGMEGYYGDGGGGGTYVYNYTTSTLMVAAGGGGGAGTECGGAPGNPGLIIADGGSIPGTSGGTAGQGGQGTGSGAGGGAGVFSNGGDGAPDGGGGGQSP